MHGAASFTYITVMDHVSICVNLLHVVACSAYTGHTIQPQGLWYGTRSFVESRMTEDLHPPRDSELPEVLNYSNLLT